jgi:predicted amidophosphoribosyltransferase
MGIAEIVILLAMLGLPALAVFTVLRLSRRRPADPEHVCPACGAPVHDCEAGCSNCGCDAAVAKRG